jgi:hypothetical protein
MVMKEFVLFGTYMPQREKTSEKENSGYLICQEEIQCTSDTRENFSFILHAQQNELTNIAA